MLWAPTGASIFAFGSGMSGYSSAAVVDVDAVAPPRLPSSSPDTPPPSPRAEIRRCLLALGVPLSSLPSSSRGRRAGAWSPAKLGLANGVTPYTLIPGGSSDEDEHGESSSRRQCCGWPWGSPMWIWDRSDSGILFHLVALPYLLGLTRSGLPYVAICMRWEFRQPA